MLRNARRMMMMMVACMEWQFNLDSIYVHDGMCCDEVEHDFVPLSGICPFGESTHNRIKISLMMSL